MGEDEFVELFGGIYEHSVWIAREAWRFGLDERHDTPAGLSAVMADVVEQAAVERQLELIRAHPDLAGRAAVQGELTAESTSEQASAGIDRCTPREFERFQRFNHLYKDKFGFPFVMAVKGSNRFEILGAFEERLDNDVETEVRRALDEIHKIARLRLNELAGR
jgi:OHCU decarboxylase